MSFYEEHKRSLIKTLSYRIIVVLSDIVIIFALTHRYDLTIGAVVGTNVVTTILYYFHERVWNHIRWGKFHRK